MPFDRLYKKDSSGRIRIWDIRVEPHEGDSFIIKTRTGLEEGTINEPAGKIVTTGKQNRTIREQANSQAQSKWMKKLDEGYKISRASATTDIVVMPMLAQTFSKAARHIVYPAVGQRKFDGVRCIAMEATGFPSNIALLTRKNKEFAGLNELRAEIALLNLPPSIVLDGELFSSTLSFQRASGLVRKQTLTDQDQEDLEQISYRIYDLINLSNPTMPFVGRYRLLQSLLNAVPSARRPRLVITRNVRINNEEDVVRWLGQFEREGYEGLMVRNLESPYELNKRSKHLQKVKTFMDEEFPIVGYYEATGNDRGTPVWECVAPNGRRFRARPMGTLAERYVLWANRDAMIGRLLTVRFFEYTDDGVPRFPVGVVIRDYEGEDTEESNAESFEAQSTHFDSCVRNGFSLYGRKLYYDCRQEGSIVPSSIVLTPSGRNTYDDGATAIRFVGKPHGEHLDALDVVSNMMKPNTIPDWRETLVETNRMMRENRSYDAESFDAEWRDLCADCWDRKGIETVKTKNCDECGEGICDACGSFATSGCDDDWGIICSDADCFDSHVESCGGCIDYIYEQESGVALQSESFAGGVETWYEVKCQEFPTSDLELFLRTDDLEGALDDAYDLLRGAYDVLMYRVEIYRLVRWYSGSSTRAQLIFSAKYDYWTSNVSDESELMATISRRFPERRRI